MYNPHRADCKIEIIQLDQFGTQVNVCWVSPKDLKADARMFAEKSERGMIAEALSDYRE